MARLLAMTLDLRPNRRDQPKITLAEEPRERRRLSGSERGGSERRGKGARAESERARAESERREREWASSQVCPPVSSDFADAVPGPGQTVEGSMVDRADWTGRCRSQRVSGRSGLEAATSKAPIVERSERALRLNDDLADHVAGLHSGEPLRDPIQRQGPINCRPHTSGQQERDQVGQLRSGAHGRADDRTAAGRRCGSARPGDSARTWRRTRRPDHLASGLSASATRSPRRPFR